MVVDQKIASESTAWTDATGDDLFGQLHVLWQIGNWSALAQFTREQIKHHPKRAWLALWVAAGHQGQGNKMMTRTYVQMALGWGCNTQAAMRILLSGVYNTLGRACILHQDNDKARIYFKKSINICETPHDNILTTLARMGIQTKAIWDCKLEESHALITILHGIVEYCVRSDDIINTVDNLRQTRMLSEADALDFHIMLSNEIYRRGDRLTAIDILRFPLENELCEGHGEIKKVISEMLRQGRSDLAIDLAVDRLLTQALNQSGLKREEIAAIVSAYTAKTSQANKKIEHGHDLLIDYLKNNIRTYKQDLKDRAPVLIEIGSTRENVPGQGSTRKLAEICKQLDIAFITVDMDPHNTKMAQQMFDRLRCRAQAITAKGEDYLRAYEDEFDFIFLDAYDFDHGNHSSLRQSRYVKYLGSKINDATCHQMHLDCAQSVNQKLTKKGVVCFDDTWLEKNKWMAKGTLGVPYLLSNGFAVIEARNRAALLQRTP